MIKIPPPMLMLFSGYITNVYVVIYAAPLSAYVIVALDSVCGVLVATWILEGLVLTV